MTNKLVVIINSLKVPKIKKILLYEMKFLVPNYSCFQNPWLGGYCPRIPVLCVLCPQLNLLNPPPNKIPGYATVIQVCWQLASSWFYYKKELQFACYEEILKDKKRFFSPDFVAWILHVIIKDLCNTTCTVGHWRWWSRWPACILQGITPFLTLILLTWRIWWAPNNASRWQMGFNSAFKGLNGRLFFI